MSKYSPLGDFLRGQRVTLVPMTFAQIERIIGSKLPPSQRYPAWWSNNPGNNVMTQVWLDAGFESEQVDIERGKLVFRRVRENAPAADHEVTLSDRGPQQHPLFGCLKGTVRVGQGVDLTEPADPEWGAHSYEDQPYRDRR
jgi:hypothetical protein